MNSLDPVKRELVETGARALDDVLGPWIAAGIISPAAGATLISELGKAVFARSAEAATLFSLPRTAAAVEVMKRGAS